MNSSFSSSRPAEVLLAEDNDNDVELTKQGFKRTKLLLNLHRVRNGVECLAFLRKEGLYADSPTPDLILLDMNMPKMNGRQVLAEMKEDEHLKCMPVIILSTSEQAGDVMEMYQMSCSSYIVKPVDFDQFVKTIQTFTSYWFAVVLLPLDIQT